jgi:sulfatase modifying factor 1
MGSPAGEAERSENELQHEVMLSRGFWLADTACTQALWQGGDRQ